MCNCRRVEFYLFSSGRLASSVQLLLPKLVGRDRFVFVTSRNIMAQTVCAPIAIYSGLVCEIFTPRDNLDFSNLNVERNFKCELPNTANIIEVALFI